MTSKQLISLQQSALTTSVANLDTYINWAYQIPILSEAEERELTQNLHESGDLDSAKKLILAHLRYVVKIARGYTGYGLPLADLIQEGNVGLMKAVRRFDPAYGVRLVTLAVYWIKSEIHDFVVKNWRIVKVATTKAQRKLFFNLRGYKKKLGSWFTSDEIEQIATDLNVSKKEVTMMEQRLHAIDSAFDAPEDDDTAFLAPCNCLEDKSANPAFIVEKQDDEIKGGQDLSMAIKQLDGRSQDIIHSRWLADPKATLHDLAAKYSVSAERIRQLEKNAMKKIKQFLGTSLNNGK